MFGAQEVEKNDEMSYERGIFSFEVGKSPLQIHRRVIDLNASQQYGLDIEGESVLYVNGLPGSPEVWSMLWSNHIPRRQEHIFTAFAPYSVNTISHMFQWSRE